MDDKRIKEFARFCEDYRFDSKDRLDIAAEITKMDKLKRAPLAYDPLRLIHVATFKQYRRRFLERLVEQIWHEEMINYDDVDEIFKKITDKDWQKAVDKAVENVLNC